MTSSAATNTAPGAYLYPRRADAGVRPLIEASQAFPAIEELALAARSDLCFGFRIFDPGTRLRSAQSAALNLETWSDLIAYKTANGTSVRLLLTDFEPVVAHELHKRTWTAIDGFARAVAAAGDTDRFQAIAALHEGEFGWLVRLGLWPFLKARAEKIASGSGQAGRVGFQSWRLLRDRGGQPGRTLGGPPRMWPATYHQKFVVADGAHAIVGGLDLDERRYDDPDHTRPAGQTWHDVSLSVSGDVAADVRDHFNTCWNFEVPRFNARMTRMGAHAQDMASPMKPAVRAPRTDAQETVQSPCLRLIRTSSMRSRSWLSIGPQPNITEIETAHLAQIRETRDCLYLESQFLRSRRLTDALVSAGRAQPGLHLIVLLPAATDEVVFDGDRGLSVRHGEWLQVRALDRIRAAYGERCGFFSLTRGTPGTETGERDAVEGQEIAYVHAKVAIADGETALVSSANLNGRSLRWDREAGVFWENTAGVTAFQRTLWQQHLRREYQEELTVTGASALQMWRAAAARGPDGGPEGTPDGGPDGEGSAQVVAYPLEKARKFARYWPIVPHDMV